MDYIYGKLNQKVEKQTYKGKATDTTTTFVDNINNTISVDINDKYTKDIDEKITNYIVSEDILKKISTQKNPQGVVAICSMRKEKEISHNNVLYLDGVSDPGNLGTLLRTALAFSFKDVILSKGSVSLYNEKTISSSQGAIFRLNIISGDEQNLINLKVFLKNDY